MNGEQLKVLSEPEKMQILEEPQKHPEERTKIQNYPEFIVARHLAPSEDLQEKDICHVAILSTN